MCNVQCAMYNVQCTMCNVQLLQRQGSQQPFMLNNLTNCRQCLFMQTVGINVVIFVNIRHERITDEFTQLSTGLFCTGFPEETVSALAGGTNSRNKLIHASFAGGFNGDNNRLTAGHGGHALNVFADIPAALIKGRVDGRGQIMGI